ncbi:hypothetical protein EEL34_13135 [Muribaculaceae bacterium Isolate-039 (Harlan)]|nr:hypothetical protein EEL34_13135 [Muribaculaceae bacterium Isolate-039 (Harlan)]
MGKCLPLHSLLRSKACSGRLIEDITLEMVDRFAGQILRKVKIFRKVCEIQIKVVPLQSFPLATTAIEKAMREH